jgi:hypothetical protein
MAEIIGKTTKGAILHCYNTPTNLDEVKASLRAITLQFKQTKIISVVTGTHGDASGCVLPSYKEGNFKTEDLATASTTNSKITLLQYQLLSGNSWKKLRDRNAATHVVVLAFCFSEQWFLNHGPNGNDGKI